MGIQENTMQEMIEREVAVTATCATITEPIHQNTNQFLKVYVSEPHSIPEVE